MSLKFKHIKLLKNAAAAVMFTNPKLNITKVLSSFEQDIQTGNQSLTGVTFNYLSSLRGINPEVVKILNAKDTSSNDTNIKPQLETFKNMIELKFTPELALDWLQKLKPEPLQATRLMISATPRMHVLMVERHENYQNTFRELLNKDGEFYIEGLQEWHLQELFSPAMGTDLKIARQIAQLEHELEFAFDQGYPVNATALMEIAQEQVATDNLSNAANPRFRRMKKEADEAVRNQVHVSFVQPSTTQITWSNSLAKALPSPINFDSRIISNISTEYSHETAVLAIFLLLVASSVCCVFTKPISLLKYASGKVLGIFDNKEQGHTYVAVPFSPHGTTDSAAQDPVQRGIMGCLDRYIRRTNI